MSKAKQKQSTLFSAWGGSSSSSSTRAVGSARDQAGAGGEEYGFENFDDLEEFFQDDVTEELSHGHETVPASKGSHSVLNASIIEDIPGFDVHAGEIWIYPTNYPVRDYQFNIVQKALFKNTLVCLPTGLGKTFIAAVVMYNFYRWYPSQKIVFLAPTKPLVAQQIEACYNVAGIPQEHAAEMTGNLPPRERVQEWQKRRVFFLTPQVMQNDLARGACPAHEVCCVVFDEAHKALGNHAYCQVIKELASAGSRFRVLALSATPGNDLKAVQQVVTNLQVSHIELRSEDSFDIQAYVHERKVEKEVVPIEGELLEVKTAFLKVLSGVVSRLSRHNLLYHSNPDRLSKYQLLQARDQFRQAGPPPGVQIGAIEGDFALAISLYHAYELLQQHGMRSFYQFLSQPGFSGGPSKAKMELMRSMEFARIMRSLEERIGSGSDTDCGRLGRSPRGGAKGVGSQAAGSQSPFFYSHPKLNKLEEVVLGHFRSFQDRASSAGGGPSYSVSTRVMIFSQYRESVQEIAEMLSRHAPLVRVMSFVGHGSTGKSNKGLTQKEQTEVVQRFREGGYNTLVATCVGEEGLDIGEVDLIVCFDAHKSPIRLVQRMGRTGRKRGGRIVVIVAQGKEEQIYLKSQSNKNSIHRAIRDGRKSLHFFQNSLRMVPRHIHPTVHKMHMTIGKFTSSTSSKASRKGRPAKSKSVQSRLGFEQGNTRKDGFLSDAELAYWSENFALSDRDFRAIEKAVGACVAPQSSLLSVARLDARQQGESLPSLLSQASQNTSHAAASTSLLNSSTTCGKYSLGLDRWVHWQTAPVPHKVVGHSLRTSQLTSLLEFMDVFTSEGMAQSYEMEMQTFLNPEDVKMAPDGGKGRSSSPMALIQGGAGARRKGRKRRRVLEDSSDDEDFQSAGAKAVGKPPSGSVSPVQALGCREGSHGGVNHRKKSKEEEDVIIIDVEDGAEMEDDCYEVPAEAVGDRDLTASQHVVPRPPSMESLDWLDAIEPSQISTPKESQNRRGTKPSLGGVAASNSKRKSFEFVTPKAPPSSRKFHTPCRTSHVRPRTPSVPRYADSIDLFSDLSSTALLEDFSDVDLGLEASSAKKAETELSCARCDKLPSGLNPEQNQTEVSNMELDPNVTIVGESDIEEQDIEEEPKPDSPKQLSPIGAHPTTPVLEQGRSSCVPETPEDSFLLVHGRKSRKEPNFLRSPTTPTSAFTAGTSVSPGSKENSAAMLNQTGRHRQCASYLQQVKHRQLGRERRGRAGNKDRKTVVCDSDSSGDEFAVPLMRRLKKSKTETNRVPVVKSTAAHNQKESGISTSGKSKATERRMGCGFVEEEAELSDDLFGGSSDETEPDSCDSDCEDSFINDATMLTQFSPTQRPEATSRATRPPPTAADMYRRSLMSPDTLFAGKRRGCGNQYRMVFSQRHQLLNHYIKKAGLQVADSAKKAGKRRRRLVLDDWDTEKVAMTGVGHDGGTTGSSSEAEEVQCVEEDLEEIGRSEDLEDSELLCGEDLELSEVGGPSCKRRAALSESDEESGGAGLGAESGNHVDRESHQKQVRLGTPQRTTPIPSAGSELVAGNKDGFGVSGMRQSSAGSLRTPSADEIISPSLLANIRIRRTPACYSLGMDDWITDSDSEGEGEGEGENPGPLQPTESQTHRLTSSDVDSDAMGQEALSDMLDAPLTEEEIERNFDFEVDDFNNCEAVNTEPALTTPSLHQVAGQTSEAAISTGKCLQPPVALGVRECESLARPVSPAGLTSTESCFGSGTSTKGTILVSAREVTYSQVVSTLRYKHHLNVLLCPLSHGGFIVSNRMAVERKLQSDLSTAPSGSKILSKLRELGELFSRTCLVVEKDPVREGRKKSATKPGHYMEYALARLLASSVTVLFSQSQEDSTALLAKLVETEGRKGHAISLPDGLQDQAQPVLQMLLKVPHMNYITALNLCASFGTLHELIYCSPEELKQRVPSLHSAGIQEILNFFQHKLNPNLIG